MTTHGGTLGGPVQVSSKDFDREVLEARAPVLVDFYADWCGPCRMVAPVLEELSQAYSGKAKFVKVNTDENSDLLERFGIMSIPTIIMFSNGSVKERIVGSAPPAVYKQKLDGVLKSQARAATNAGR
jgi:thioredoxin 1